MIPGSGAQLLEVVTVLCRSPGGEVGRQKVPRREFRTEKGGMIGQKEGTK